jgi:pimeloyl-ACP methyl ester carboxylesterase
MQIDVNGTPLWFDVDGPALVPDGPRMGERPTVILVHGGPGSYDHSYFRPHFAHLAGEAQVVYLDLRDHGRSARHDPADWGFELCADDLRAFCDAIGIVRPFVLGHSMGGFIAMLDGARHPGHAGALILQSTFARFDLARLVEEFRRVAGDEIAELARRDYGGDPVNDEEWTRIFAAFGPQVPNKEELARRIRIPELGGPGMELLRRLDIVDQLACITCPTGLRGRARSRHPGGCLARDRRGVAAWDRAARSDRASRSLPLVGHARSILVAHQRVRDGGDCSQPLHRGVTKARPRFAGTANRPVRPP